MLATNCCDILFHSVFGGGGSKKGWIKRFGEEDWFHHGFTAEMFHPDIIIVCRDNFSGASD